MHRFPAEQQERIIISTGRLLKALTELARKTSDALGNVIKQHVISLLL